MHPIAEQRRCQHQGRKSFKVKYTYDPDTGLLDEAYLQKQEMDLGL